MPTAYQFGRVEVDPANRHDIARRMGDGLRIAIGAGGMGEKPSGRAMFERSLARLRAALGPAVLEAALSAGRALDDDAARAEALAWLEGLP